MPLTEDQSDDSSEWAVAKAHFKKGPKKNSPRDTILKLQRASSHYHNPQDPSTTHSYLQFKDALFRLLPGETKPNGAIAGTGFSSRVKYLIDQEGKRYTVKIDKYDYAESHRTQSHKENIISLKLGFFKMVGYRTKPPKAVKKRIKKKLFRYAVMDDLGESLYTYLKRKNHLITDKQRLALAFKACIQVHQLHSGYLSPRCQDPIAHLDIKVGNFYYDETKNKLTLGDYGMAEYNITSLPDDVKGTPNNLPYTRHYPEFERWSRKALDLFALKRSCYCPLKRMTMLGYHDNPKDLPPMILTDAILDTHGLRPYFKTTDNNEQDYSPLLLAAICLLAGINQAIYISKIEKSEIQQQAIIVLHYAHSLDNTHLQAMLKDPNYAQSLAKHINQLEDLPSHEIMSLFHHDGKKASLRHTII